jgi:hypothetical protein
MKHSAFACVAVLAGCTGNWSNSDLEFVSALPVKSELQSKIPSTAQPLSGENTRRDPLGLGEASQSYLDARKASNDFNGLLDGLLAIVEAIRTIAPTSRTADTRSWGPFPDDKNPGYEAQLVIARTEPADGGAVGRTFGWKIEYRLKQGPGEWFEVVRGNYLATGGVRKGQGAVEILIAENVGKLKTLEAFGPIARIVTGYVTDQNPITVNMAFTFSANDAGVSELGYGYREDGDKAGKINFGLRTTDANVTLLNTTAGWLPSGAGVATARVDEGAYTGANAIECWDEAFKTVYAFQSWPGGANLGSASSCVTLPF